MVEATAQHQGVSIRTRRPRWRAGSWRRTFINHALGKTKHLTSRDIRVHAAAGVVTLSGSVPNRSALDRAAQAAQEVPGVMAVRNNLTIENR
ncbi:BON domain-containing protein [Paraburkholderia hospita]|uniref:BON domain-containing protein n=1 Tax=Paraburkholderia hospita TaxID=169430 RepID=UPI003ED0E7F4